MVFMSPSVHDISRMANSHITHCLSVWSQQHRPLSRPLRHTHTHAQSHIHKSTVCHCITLHSLGHTVYIYSFITMRHFVWRKALLLSTLGLPLPSAAGLGCSVYQGYSLPVLLCFTSKCPAAHTASGRLTKPTNTAETIKPQHSLKRNVLELYYASQSGLIVVQITL